MNICILKNGAETQGIPRKNIQIGNIAYAGLLKGGICVKQSAFFRKLINKSGHPLSILLYVGYKIMENIWCYWTGEETVNKRSERGLVCFGPVQPSVPTCRRTSAWATWQQATRDPQSEHHRPIGWVTDAHSHTAVCFGRTRRGAEIEMFSTSPQCVIQIGGLERKGEVLSRGFWRMNSFPRMKTLWEVVGGEEKQRRDGCRSGWCDTQGQTWFFRQTLKKPPAVMETMCCDSVSKPQKSCLQSLGTRGLSVTLPEKYVGREWL